MILGLRNWAYSLPQDKKWPNEKQNAMGARRIGNKGPGGAQDRIRIGPGLLGGIGAA